MYIYIYVYINIHICMHMKYVLTDNMYIQILIKLLSYIQHDINCSDIVSNMLYCNLLYILLFVLFWYKLFYIIICSNVGLFYVITYIAINLQTF